MWNEWPRVVISDVCELIVDCVNKTAPVVEGPTPFKMIRTPNVKNGVVNTDTCRFVESETFEKWTRRASVKIGDVLLTREAPLGEVGIVTSGEKLFLGQRLMQYRANPELLDSKFLLYSFLSHDLQHQFSMHEGSGSVVSHIRVGDCLKFELNLPPLNEQKRISHALGSIDQKIQLNRETNQTLEAMAQALFESWFVRFDLVIDKALEMGKPIPKPFKVQAEARQILGKRLASTTESGKKQPTLVGIAKTYRELFPSEFEEIEKFGYVPKGWKVGLLSDLANLITRSIDPSKEPDKKWLHFSLPAFDKRKTPAQDLGSEIKSGKYWVPELAVLVSKLNPHTPRVWLPSITNIAASVCSTEFMPFVPNKAEWREYLYALMCSKFMNDELASRVTGTTGSHQRIRPKEIAILPILIPPNEVVAAFSEQMKVLYDKIQQGISSNIALESLRDTLLPKLISGELRIPDTEAQVEEAI
jgi:type I restriction enzyme S subunit